MNRIIKISLCILGMLSGFLIHYNAHFTNILILEVLGIIIEISCGVALYELFAKQNK